MIFMLTYITVYADIFNMNPVIQAEKNTQKKPPKSLKIKNVVGVYNLKIKEIIIGRLV